MRKKILIHNGSLRLGGIERRVVEFLENVDLSKFSITLVIDDDAGEQDVFRSRIPKGINLIYLKNEKIFKFNEWLRNHKKNLLVKVIYNLMMNFGRKYEEIRFKKIVNQDQFEVILDFDSGLSRFIEKVNGPVKIGRQFNSITNLYKGNEKRINRYGKRLEKYDYIIAICDDMKEEIEGLFPKLKGKVKRFYNSFDIEAIKSSSQNKNNLLTEEKELLKEKYIISVSRLDNVQKDYYTVLKAMRGVKDAGEDIKLFIAGDGPGRSEIEKWIEEFGLNNQVKLLGYQSNPYIWLENSEFFLHSSRYEGFCSTLVEAMICNKAIISSDSPIGPGEILDRGEYGILVEVGDSEGFKNGILNLLRDEELKKKYLQKCIERVSEFDKNVVIKKIEKMLLSV